MYLYHNYNNNYERMHVCVSVPEDISTCLNLHGCYALPNPVYFKKITFIIVIVKISSNTILLKAIKLIYSQFRIHHDHACRTRIM